MIAPDANLLIFAHDSSSPFFRASRAWFESILSGDELVGIPNLCVYAFLRFVTNSKLVAKPLSFERAVNVVDVWLAVPHVSVLLPGQRHWLLLSQLAGGSRLRGAQLNDAAIGAISLEYGATVHTHDRDFARLPGVRWFDPIQS